MNAPSDLDRSGEAQFWSDELARIVMATEVPARLAQLGRWLGFEPGALPPEGRYEAADLESHERGIAIKLVRPDWRKANRLDPEAWAIQAATFDATRAPLPFGLDALSETPQRARRKLGDDAAFFPESRTVTHYLGDARVVAITYAPDMQKIVSVAVTRLGSPVVMEL